MLVDGKTTVIMTVSAEKIIVLRAPFSFYLQIDKLICEFV